MAVTKIRKLSSWTLYVVMAITIGILALFFFGGETEFSTPDKKDPVYTSQLLYWGYIVAALAITGLVVFGIQQFITSFIDNPKGAVTTLGILLGFGALFLISYIIGDATPLPGINVDSAKFNVPGWLKVTDMWIYMMYIMGTLCILASLASSLMKLFNK